MKASSFFLLIIEEEERARERGGGEGGVEIVDECVCVVTFIFRSDQWSRAKCYWGFNQDFCVEHILFFSLTDFTPRKT